MASASDGGEPRALRIPEIIAMIISHLESSRDLLNCAYINSTWSLVALEKLYKGSLNDMRFRTPDIGSLNCLFVASLERFARNMSFVDHLILGPENVAFHEGKFGDFSVQPCCVENCRALQSRHSSQLLFQPYGRGARSLALPFEFLHQNINDIFDLALHKRLEFLTIDTAYVEELLSSLSTSGNKRNYGLNPPLLFPNLRALSIHLSSPISDTFTLCRALDFLNLKLFQIQHEGNQISIEESEMLKLLKSLRRHKNLEVLSLKGILEDSGPSYDLMEFVKEIDMQAPWPRLRALYLADLELSALENLAKYEKLESISLFVEPISMLEVSVTSLPAKNVARCRQLRVVDIKMDNVPINDVEWLLQIAHGCPMLQKLRFKTNSDPEEVEMTEARFSEILEALPCIKLLTLDIMVCVSGSTLLDLSCHAPRLSALRMTRSRLELSHQSLQNASPIPFLEQMEFQKIIFDDPLRLSHPHQLACLEEQWKRVFPLLWKLPCSNDARHTYAYCNICDDIGEAEDGQSGVSNSFNSTKSSPEDVKDHYLEFRAHDSEPDEYHLRRRLWRVLNFHLTPSSAVPNDYIWQTNFETKNFGWPVLPLSAFLDPLEYSSSNKEYEK